MEDSGADLPHRPTRKEAIALSRKRFNVGTAHVEGCDVVLIGRGDYTEKMVLPGVREAARRHLLPTDLRLITVDRNPVAPRDLDDERHIQMDLQQTSDYRRLREVLGRPGERRVVYYLAVSPALYVDVATGLREMGLCEGNFVAVVEKPIGSDTASSLVLQAELRRLFGVGRVVFNDHYLAKPALWSLGNGAHATLLPADRWNRLNVSQVVAQTFESRGIGERGGYFDRTGLLKDVFCHLMKVVCTVGMGTGRSWPEARLEVLRRIRIDDCVRGQYRAGNGEVGYLDEAGVPRDSTTETYFGVKLRIDSLRWRGVPWIIEAGKRSSVRRGIVTLDTLSHRQSPLAIPLHPVGSQDLPAHARIISDAYAGNTGLWTPGAEVRREWELLDEIVRQWRHDAEPLHLYDAGIDRPDAAYRLFSS